MLRNVRSSHLSTAFKLRLSILLNVFACVLLLGNASPLWAQVTTTQAAVSFGSVAVGAATGSTQSLTFTVPSGITLGGISAETQGAANLDFTVAKGGSCASGVTSTSCTVQVRFLPTAPGLRMGAVVLTDQSTPPSTLITVPLSGVGTGPMVAFGPGIITTFAGDYAKGPGYSGDGGPATGAQLSAPWGAAMDGYGNLYIADSDNSVVRKVTPGGTITTYAGRGASLAGSSCVSSGDGGPAISAQLCAPTDVALDGAGNLYIADRYSDVVREVKADGTITTVAGKGQCVVSACSQSGDGGPATGADLMLPDGLTVDGAGNLYIAQGGTMLDGWGVVRKVTPGGTITTFAGIYKSTGYSGDGGPATSALLYLPRGLAVDGTGDLYIADSGNQVIRKVAPDGTITTVAGKVQCCGGWAGTSIGGYSGDGGPATSAQLNLPTGLAVDGAGNFYIADTNNSVIRKVTPDGTITTVVGNGICPTLSTTVPCYSGDNGPATSAQLYMPFGVAVDGTGDLYVVDGGDTSDNKGDNVIRKVDVSAAPALTFAALLWAGRALRRMLLC